jgi:AcrR family transcriptional regulator
VRRRTPSDQLEPAILEAAEAILEEGGPDALSVRRIAERAGVAPMGLYSRFDGKLGVIDALFMEGFAELGSTIRAASESAVDPVAGFRDTGLAYRALAVAHPSRYRVMFLGPVAGYEPSVRAVEVATAAFGALVDAVARCIDAGTFEHVDAVEAAQQVWSACHGWVALELQGICFCDDADAGYAGLLDVLERGLAARVATPSS